jgi:hypothetical protein
LRTYGSCNAGLKGRKGRLAWAAIGHQNGYRRIGDHRFCDTAEYELTQAIMRICAHDNRACTCIRCMIAQRSTHVTILGRQAGDPDRAAITRTMRCDCDAPAYSAKVKSFTASRKGRQLSTHSYASLWTEPETCRRCRATSRTMLRRSRTGRERSRADLGFAFLPALRLEITAV